eukprot:s2018_g2.t1
MTACMEKRHRRYAVTSLPAFLAAGGGSDLGAQPLQSVRECVISAAPKPEATERDVNCPGMTNAEPVGSASGNDPGGNAVAPGNNHFQRGSSNGSLADRIVGGGPAHVDRDDLLARGMTNQQVDAIEVQARIAEELRAHIVRWVLCFMCTLCVVGVTSFGLMIWLIISQGPGWYFIKIYMFLFHKYVIRCVCRYDPRENPTPPPWYVKLYNLLFPTFDFVWNITGIVLAATSKTCSTIMPDVYHSILAFASCGLFIAVWFLINAVGLQVILAYMMRHGMLPPSENAAPKGTIEKQEVFKFDSNHDWGDNNCCSICLEEWSGRKEIRKTACGHFYHTDCLKGWLNVNRNCPLCRTDLVTGQAATGQAIGALQNGMRRMADACALRFFLRRCPALRCAEVTEPGLVSGACSGLASCSKLRALKLSLSLVPNIVNLGQVFKSCKQLRVLVLTSTSEYQVSLQYLTEELSRSCGLRELCFRRCSATWKDLEVLCKACPRLQELRLPEGYIDAGGPLSPPPLVPLGRLKQLRAVDLRGHSRAQKAKCWLTDDMFGILAQVRHLREVRADHQRLLSDRCCWFLRRHCFRLRVLHLSGCRAMCGESVFGLLHMCDGRVLRWLMTVDVQHDVQSVAQAPAKGYMSDLKAFLRPGIGRSLLEFERLTWPLLLGNTLEWYEFGVYGYVEREISENFFGGSEDGGWFGFAITFVARPMGGFTLGYIADNIGRKLSVNLSLGGMIVATVGQGLLPGKYFLGGAEDLGLVFLICFRALQGLSAGGEIGAVSSYLVEVSPVKTLGMAVCMISVGSQIAWAFASLLVALLSSSLTDQQMLEWGWRIPFLISAIPGAISMWGRNRIPETDTFLEIGGEGATSRSRFGFFELLKEHRLSLLVGFGACFATATMWPLCLKHGP